MNSMLAIQGWLPPCTINGMLANEGWLPPVYGEWYVDYSGVASSHVW